MQGDQKALALCGNKKSSSDDKNKKKVGENGGGNGEEADADDPNNAPEFDEIKQKIEKNIKFNGPHADKILASNSDYKNFVLNIEGDFFQELGKLEKPQLDYQAYSSTRQTSPKKMDISKQMITSKRIPLSLDLSQLQPQKGLQRAKLKLKFSSNDKQIIQKEWTQKMILKGKSVLSFQDENFDDLTEGVIYTTAKTVKIKAENIDSSIQVRVESELKDVSASGANITSSFTPINLPSKAQTKLTESTESLDAPHRGDGDEGFKAYLVKARTFFRLKESETWKPLTDTLYRSYSIDVFQEPNKLTIEMNKTLLDTGDDLIITIKKLRKSDFIRFYVQDIDPRSSVRSADMSKAIISITSVTGQTRALRDNGRTANTLPVDWRGRHWWTDFSKTTNAVQKDYRFTLKGFKDRSFLLYVLLVPDDFSNVTPVVAKILARP